MPTSRHSPSSLLRGTGFVLASLSLCLASPPVAPAQPTIALSVDVGGDPGNDVSDAPSISEDGRYVAFTSKATDLIALDTNGRRDVFVRDRVAGTTVRVSVSSAGVAADRDCENPSISRDGRWVAFDSTATNLVAADGNGVRDVFLHDRDVDEDGIFDEPGQVSTIRASVDGLGLERTRASSVPSVSAGGEYVAFQGNKSSGQSDILIFDAAAGATFVASVDSAGVVGNGDAENPQISASGRYLVYDSNSDNLVAADGNGKIDAFLHDRDPDEDGVFDEVGEISTIRVSVDSVGAEGNDHSRYPWVSDDGRFVVFASTADDLVGSDTNGKRDVFLRDVAGGSTTLVSQSLAGIQGDLESTYPAISGDGRIVIFQTAATNLVLSDGNSRRDVLVLDRDTEADGIFDEAGFTALYFVSVDTGGSLGNDHSGEAIRPKVSASGLFATFSSVATNLVANDTNGKRDVFGRFTSECGNLILTADEDCDDGNVVNGDGCDANCTFTGCGNGIQTAGEACDDGNPIDGDGCDTNCTITGCGNGIVTAGEDCDDGNAVSGDGCDANCTFTGCGNGIATAGEACDEGAQNEVGGCCSGTCTLIDFDADLTCDVDDLAEIPSAALGKVTVKDSGGDPDRPTGSVVWKGDLFVQDLAPYFTPAALLAQGEIGGFRAEVFATVGEPTTADTPVFTLDFDPSDCTFGGPVGERKKAKCKIVLPPPHLTVLKLTLAARASSMVFKGVAKRADTVAPAEGPLWIVLGLDDVPPLEFYASADECVLKGNSKKTLKCTP